MLTVDFSKINIKPGQLILDLGCGEGRHCIGAVNLDKQLTIVGVDLSLKDLRIALERYIEHQQFQACEHKNNTYSLNQADAQQLPFRDKVFDHVICSEVLEHIHQYDAVLEEIYRILKPGGSLTISVPRAWPERICWWLSKEYYQVDGGHIRIFDANNLRQEIEALSFRAIDVHWAHSLHVPYWWLRCAFWEKGNDFFLTRWYHKLLVWDLFHKPWLTTALDRLFNPLMGKSIVLYFAKD